MEIEIGNTVKRHASDYTDGRTGQVIEISDNRYRVHWTKCSSGRPLNIRTWVNERFISPVELN